MAKTLTRELNRLKGLQLEDLSDNAKGILYGYVREAVIGAITRSQIKGVGLPTAEELATEKVNDVLLHRNLGPWVADRNELAKWLARCSLNRLKDVLKVKSRLRGESIFNELKSGKGERSSDNPDVSIEDLKEAKPDLEHETNEAFMLGCEDMGRIEDQIAVDIFKASVAASLSGDPSTPAHLKRRFGVSNGGTVKRYLEVGRICVARRMGCSNYQIERTCDVDRERIERELKRLEKVAHLPRRK